MMGSSFGIEALAILLVASFFPPFIWLWFWLKEDDNPEPKRLLTMAFLGGILIIPAALILEVALCKALPIFVTVDYTSTSQCASSESFSIGMILLVGFALIEEFMKFFVVYALILWRKEYDEPVDAMIYMVTASLGFAAAENIFYLYAPFQTGFLEGFTLSGMRFLGPVLLHALSSAVLGYFLASSFKKSSFRKDFDFLLGLFFSTTLHAVFNVSILITGGKRIEPALVLLVAAGLITLLSFDHIKYKVKQYYANK